MTTTEHDPEDTLDLHGDEGATPSTNPAGLFDGLEALTDFIAKKVGATFAAKEDEIERLTARLNLVQGVVDGALSSTTVETSTNVDTPAEKPSDELPVAARKLDFPKGYRSWLEDLDAVLRAQTSMTYALYTLLTLHSLRRRSEDGYEIQVQGDDAPLGAALSELCQGIDALQALCIGAGLELSPAAAQFQLEQENEAAFAHYKKAHASADSIASNEG